VQSALFFAMKFKIQSSKFNASFGFCALAFGFPACSAYDLENIAEPIAPARLRRSPQWFSSSYQGDRKYNFFFRGVKENFLAPWIFGFLCYIVSAPHWTCQNETTNMKRKIENPYAITSVQSMRNSEGQPIGTWLLQSITPVLFRVFYDEKFFYRDLLKFG
jgi:hypothetical protein